MSNLTNAHELPAKWRQEADDDLDSVTSWKLARRRCADELEAALRQSGEAVATIHRDGYWTHEPGRDPFDRFGPNANSSGLKVYAAPPATSGQSGEAATDTLVQTVPDKCDRIVWRGHYYHLPTTSGLVEALRYARDMIEWWAHFVGKPVQQKHDLAGCLKKIDSALAAHDAQDIKSNKS